jgi:choline-glycine betaine transporter
VFKPSLSKNKLLALIILTLFLMFLAFTIQYVNNLKKKKCECSKEITRDIMYIYSWIMVVLICLVVVVPIIMSLMLLLVKK